MSIVEETTSGVHWLSDDRCRFRIWAPHAKRVHVHLLTPEDRVLRLKAVDDGYFEKVIEGVRHSRFERRSRQIRRVFDEYRLWVEDTLTTEPQPYVQVLAAVFA